MSISWGICLRSHLQVRGFPRRYSANMGIPDMCPSLRRVGNSCLLSNTVVDEHEVRSGHTPFSPCVLVSLLQVLFEDYFGRGAF